LKLKTYEISQTWVGNALAEWLSCIASGADGHMFDPASAMV
jgi:hypothetical protein